MYQIPSVFPIETLEECHKTTLSRLFLFKCFNTKLCKHFQVTIFYFTGKLIRKVILGSQRKSSHGLVPVSQTDFGL